MKTLFLVVVLLFIFAVGGFYLGGPVGGLISLILLNCIGLHLTGGFRMQNKPPAMTFSRDMQSNLPDEGSVG